MSKNPKKLKLIFSVFCVFAIIVFIIRATHENSESIIGSNNSDKKSSTQRNTPIASPGGRLSASTESESSNYKIHKDRNDPFGGSTYELILSEAERDKIIKRITLMNKTLSFKDRGAAAALILKASEADQNFANSLIELIDPYSAVYILGKYNDRLAGIITLQPSKTTALLDSLVWSDHNRSAIHAIVFRLSESSPEEVALWIEKKKPSPFTMDLCKEIYAGKGFAQIKPEAFLSVLQGIEDPLIKLAATQGYLHHIAVDYPDESFQLMMLLPKSDRSKALGDFISSAATKNANTAFEWLEKSEKNYENSAVFEASQKTIKIQAGRDLEAAISLAENTKNDIIRNGAVSGLVHVWSMTDIQAASEWLSKQAAGPARDAGAQEIINQIKDTDPEMAEQWRKSMTPN
jgi:hypothetical protein